MFQPPFVTYSQNGEDVLLWRALQSVQHGFYIDVGAQDPVEYSVTKAFYERGWRGINIEPVPHWHDRLVADRPHDINLRLAVSSQPGTLKLFEVEDTGLSTSDSEFADRHEKGGYKLREREVECATLDRICADNNVETAHFLKIDCEGGEKSALESIALTDVRPWIILVEATEPNSTKPTWQDWEYLLTGRGYQFVFFDGLNRYYLADEHVDLAPAFDAPVNVFDSPRPISEVEAQKEIGRLQGEIEGLKGAAVNARLQADLDTVRAELAAVAAERDSIRADCDMVRAECSATAAERDRVIAQRDQVRAQRDDLQLRQTEIQREVKTRQQELRHLHAELVVLQSSRSWRITAPLRSCSRAGSSLGRRLRRMAYLAVRPFAHIARPLLRWLARSSMIRRGATAIFGRGSRITQQARLFLFGTASDPFVRIQDWFEDEPAADRQHQGQLQRGHGVSVAPESRAMVPDEPFDLDEVMERVRTEVAHLRERQ